MNNQLFKSKHFIIILAILIIGSISAVAVTSKSSSEASTPPSLFTTKDYVAMGSPSNLVIPNHYTKIDDSAFFNYASVTAKDQPADEFGLQSTTIGCDCIESVIIPNSITEIGDSAFAQCHNLTSINIPSSVTKIGKRAFETCWNLTTEGIKLESTNFVLNDGILYDSAKTEIISILSESVIGDITLPGSLTKIDDFAFGGCNNLTSITIPNSVKEVGEYPFEYCQNLKSIYISPSSPIYRKLKNEYGGMVKSR